MHRVYDKNPDFIDYELCWIVTVPLTDLEIKLTIRTPWLVFGKDLGCLSVAGIFQAIEIL